jgi:hypothetical protein
MLLNKEAIRGCGCNGFSFAANAAKVQPARLHISSQSSRSHRTVLIFET